MYSEWNCIYKCSFVTRIVARSLFFSLSHTHFTTAVLPFTVGSVPELWSISSDLIKRMEVGWGEINKAVRLKSSSRKCGSIVMISLSLSFSGWFPFCQRNRSSFSWPSHRRNTHVSMCTFKWFWGTCITFSWSLSQTLLCHLLPLSLFLLFLLSGF